MLVAAGLIYAGQAGATRWPSGKRPGSTLWSRITGMHLAVAAEFSTFRRTLAAILNPLLAMSGEDDPQLSAWMSAHLRVIAVPVPDPDQLGRIETAPRRRARYGARPCRSRAPPAARSRPTGRAASGHIAGTVSSPGHPSRASPRFWTPPPWRWALAI